VSNERDLSVRFTANKAGKTIFSRRFSSSAESMALLKGAVDSTPISITEHDL